MLNLFANIFGHARDAGPDLPQSLVKAAIERAVDAADPRMRIISGYAKTLREPVIHAACYAIDLVDRLPEPLAATPEGLAASPALAALFYSGTEMRNIIERDAAMREFRKTAGVASAPVTALLVVERSEKRSFGYAEVGGQMLKDVPRTTIGFSQHHLLEPSPDAAETRRGLIRRGFDQLLAVALAQITERRHERDKLSERRALLRSKLDIVRRGGDFTRYTGAGEQAELQTRLHEIDSLLSSLGTAEEVLPDNLETLAGVLAGAERHFWLEEKVLCIDKFYVLHEQPDAAAPAMVFRDLHNSEGRQVTVQLLRIPPA